MLFTGTTNKRGNFHVYELILNIYIISIEYSDYFGYEFFVMQKR